MSVHRPAVLASLLLLPACEGSHPPPDPPVSTPVGLATAALNGATVCSAFPRTDVMLLSSNPDTNELGAAGSLFFTGTTKAGFPGYTLLRFDVGSIPTASLVTSATVTVLPVYTRGIGTVNVHEVLGAWSPSTVTWDNFTAGYDPSPAASFTSGLAPASAGLVTSGFSPLSFDLSALVQQWVSGTVANDGVLLEQSLVEPSASYTYYDDAAAAPILTVCYLTSNDPCLGVTCTASDACHTAGTCDPATGACSNPPAVDGTACNDGNACTTGDGCQNGVCAGTPVTCTASDACHTAGICNPATGTCSNPPAPDGTACNDGNACTTGDACQNGLCTGTPATCTATDACHTAGTCNPATGTCSNPPAVDGTACNDGNACTTGDACQNGVCAGTPVTCTATDACHVAGTCDPATGTCSNPPAANGTACNDGNACTTGDACQNGVCTGTPTSCTASNVSPPTNLMAQSVGGHVVLTWDASPDDDILGYEVYRKITGQPDTDYLKIHPGVVTDMQFCDGAVVAGTNYSYRVQAVDDTAQASP